MAGVIEGVMNIGMGKRICTAVLAFLLPVALVFLPFVVPRAIRSRERTIWGRERAVAKEIIRYLENHPESWPSGWQDLASNADPQWVNSAECFSVWSNCVKVDWSLSRSDFMGIPSNEAAQAILYRDEKIYGRVAARMPLRKRPDVSKPNHMIWDYLNNPATR